MVGEFTTLLTSLSAAFSPVAIATGAGGGLADAQSSIMAATAAASAAATVYQATLPVDTANILDAASATVESYQTMPPVVGLDVSGALSAVSAAAAVAANAASEMTSPSVDVVAASSFSLPSFSGLDNPLVAYDTALRAHPLETKTLTAAALATAGDCFAQKLSSAYDSQSFEYDVKRGAAFATFGASYTGAFQAYWFDYLNAHLVGLGVDLGVWGSPYIPPPSSEVLAAAKVAVNQFVVVPALYMPLFFAVTGALGGLDLEASLERMRSLYGPILRRNYAFWLPVQFLAFVALPLEYQVPVLTVASLLWTVILSSLGSGKVAASLPDSPEVVPPQWVGGTPSVLAEVSAAEIEVSVDELVDLVTLEDVTEAVGDGLPEAALVVAGIAIAGGLSGVPEVLSGVPGVLSDAPTGSLPNAIDGAVAAMGEDGGAMGAILQDALEAQAIPIALALGAGGEAVSNAAEEVASNLEEEEECVEEEEECVVLEEEEEEEDEAVKA